MHRLSIDEHSEAPPLLILSPVGQMISEFIVALAAMGREFIWPFVFETEELEPPTLVCS